MLEKYTFNFGREKHMMSKGLYEKREHIVLKLIAYLYFDRKPKIETRLRKKYKYKPDLIICENDKIRLWVECGQVTFKKLEKISNDFRHADICVFRKNINSAEGLLLKILNKVENGRNIRFVTFEKGFIEDLADTLQKVNKIKFNNRQNNITILMNRKEFNSEVYTFRSNLK